MQFWSDYNRIYHHPRSITEINQYTYGDDLKKFGTFAQGQDVFADQELVWMVIGSQIQKNMLMEDRVRFFMEESDSPQGFQVFADVHDGFAGFASDFMEAIKDEYPKKSIFTMGMSPRFSPLYEKRQLARVNESLALRSLSQSSSVYIPLFVPAYENVQKQSWSRYLNHHVRHSRINHLI